MTTKHNSKCTMAFGRPTKQEGECPRCDELRTGAAPRKGWGASKRENDRRHAAEIRAHRCTPSRCGTVCTFGEW
jgi:hypothetical protein